MAIGWIKLPFSSEPAKLLYGFVKHWKSYTKYGMQLVKIDEVSTLLVKFYQHPVT